MINNELIAAFLGGSIISVVAQNIFNVFSENKKHKREMQRIKYERKLDFAEKCTAFYMTYYFKSLEVKKSYELLLESLKKESTQIINQEYFLGLVQQNADLLIELENNENLLKINSIYLYFDTSKMNGWNDLDMYSLIQVVNEIRNLDERVNLSIANEGGKVKEPHIYEEYNKKYIEYFNRLTLLFTKLNEAQLAIVQTIKEQT